MSGLLPSGIGTGGSFLRDLFTAKADGLGPAAPHVAPPIPPLPPAPPQAKVERVRQGGVIQAANLIHQMKPAYPPGRLRQRRAAPATEGPLCDIVSTFPAPLKPPILPPVALPRGHTCPEYLQRVPATAYPRSFVHVIVASLSSFGERMMLFPERNTETNHAGMGDKAYGKLRGVRSIRESGFSCVPSMFSSSEVKVFYPT